MRKKLFILLLLVGLLLNIGCVKEKNSDFACIKGASAGAVAEDLYLRYGIRFDLEKGHLSGGAKAANDSCQYYVDITCPDHDKILAIRYVINRDIDNKEASIYYQTANEFFSYIASSPFQGSKPDEVETWLIQELLTAKTSDPIEKTIGSLHYQLSGDGEKMRQLIVKPASHR